MKPDVDQILRLSAGQLMGGIAPQLGASYAQASASLLGFMMLLSAQEYDRAADIRAAENADMRALFVRLAPLVSDADLKSRLEAAAKTRDESLKISALNEANYALRRLLIALQIHIESSTDKRARAAERDIWKVLQASAERRFVASPMG
jgi:hypothetical protein